MQARLLHHLFHFAQLEHDGVLALVDGVERARNEQRDHYQQREDRS
jgi:hypothetical protein